MTHVWSALFCYRMHRLEQQYAGANVCLHKHGVLPPSVQRLWSDKRLVDIAPQDQIPGDHVDTVGHAFLVLGGWAAVAAVVAVVAVRGRDV